MRGVPGHNVPSMSDAVAAGPAPAAGDRAAVAEPRRLIVSKRLWLWVLLVGAAIWLITAIATGITDVTHMIPNVILLGSFLVPVSMVLFALSRASEGHLTAEAVLLGFLGGGTLGTVFSALTEVYFLPSTVGTFIGVGLFEETAKALVVVAAGWTIADRRPRDGMVLGATVGAGFASFESAGYALQTFIEHRNDHPVSNILSTEAERALLSPFGHLTWTALVGGAIFAAWRSGAFRPVAPVIWTFLGVVALHAAWDSSYGWAVVIAEGISGPGWQSGWPSTEDWIGTPTGSELVTFNVAYGLLIGLNAVIGTVWVILAWRKYGHARVGEGS
jgi:RsiW-degrading membrane proteinase PrsW (M82 family)